MDWNQRTLAGMRAETEKCMLQVPQNFDAANEAELAEQIRR